MSGFQVEGFSAKSRADIRRLAHRLGTVEEDDRIVLAANIAGHGMMNPQWWVRVIVVVAAWRHGLPRNVVWASILSKSPAMVDEIIAGTVGWIVGGKDADGEGVGGFNQREVDRIANWLSRPASSAALKACRDAMGEG